MAILKAKEAAKLNMNEIQNKLKDLRIELIKAQAANKKGGKTSIREVRKTIARLLTFETKINKTQPKTETKKTETKIKNKVEAKK